MRCRVLICGHGSRDPEAIAEFEEAVTRMKSLLPDSAVDHAYLEFARPVIREALEKLAARGTQPILALPAMLFAARHVKRDLPAKLEEFAADHPDIPIRLVRELSLEPKLLEAAAARVAEGERRSRDDVPRAQTLLLVVGRGTSDPEVNAKIGELARMLRDDLGFGGADIAYSGSAEPLPEPALRRAARLGFRRIVVFPYFLFTGVLVKRIYAVCDRIAADHPEIEVIKAPYLRDHPLVLECFLDRLAELADGAPAHDRAMVRQ